MTKLNDFAPYPEREEEATADRIARNFAVLGHANHRRMYDADANERNDAVATVVNMYGFVYLLREFAEVDKDRADAAARDLWSAWDAGDSLGEWLWEWLSSDYGIDPAAVTQVVEKMCAEPPTKSARVLLAEAEADRDRAREIAVALEQENARLTERMADVEKFVAARAEYITAINNCHPDNSADYWRWQGHAEGRRQLSQTLGLPVAWPAGYEGSEAL